MTGCVTLLAILFATHFLGGVAAFGSTLLALPLLLLTGWNLPPAVALLLIVGLAQAVQVTCLTWRSTDRRALAHILVVAGLGIPIGLQFGGLLPARVLGVCLGVLLIGAGASRLFERLLRKDCVVPLWALNALLLIGGVVHGAFGSGGTTLTIYGRYALQDKATFRGTLSVMWVMMNVTVLTGMAVRDQITGETVLMALPGVPVVALATWLGHRTANRLSQEQFANAVAGLLCFAGILTICRNVG